MSKYFRLTDKNYHEYIQHFNIPEDYYCFREHYPFGYCPSFRKWPTHPNDVIYIYHEKRYTWPQLKAELKETWRPKALDDQNWYMNYIAR